MGIDFVTGANYSVLLDFKKPISERVTRSLYSAVFNVMKNLLENHLNQFREQKISYVNSIGRQMYFDGLEAYTEDMCAKIVEYIVNLINEK